MRASIATAVLLLAAIPASAQALTLNASGAETGWISLTVPDAGTATRVTLSEATGQFIADVQPRAGRVVIPHAAAWLCDQRERTFFASAGYPDGSSQTATTSIRTPSCARRFRLSLRRLPGRIQIRVDDRWKTGNAAPLVCVDPPVHRRACSALVIPRGRTVRWRSVRARTGGLWTVSVGALTQRLYFPPARKLRLLATGDSMIEYVDTYLKQRLAKRRFGVRSDPRVSTGLSKPFLLNWPRLAARQARKVHPDVTVVFIGANDGFPFGSVDCCGDAWVDAYAKRAESMMRSYSRSGRGLVYWLTLPAPRPAQWRPIYPAVNRAIKRAAARVGGPIRVLDIARTFTPNGRFRQSMTWHGHRETVRQPDGVHLSPAGASITETLIERALRKDGVL